MKDRDLKEVFLKGTFLFIIGTALMTLCLFSLIEGLHNHNARDLTLALVYYFLSVLSFIAAIVLYLQSKKLFYYVELEK